ncbi:phage late control D family protein [Lysinibacillus sp. NPDC093692]|uniref:phage late control D family protein n=1 Tax=Lysinibacillus sp. NPDC093692 TaxID=3390578 RepID=UPI003D09542D
MSTKVAKSTKLNILYNHQSIKEILNQHLISWTYTDNLSGEIDDLNIELEDKEALWIGDWFPTKGSIIQATIEKLNWENSSFKQQIGKFEVDTINGRESVITIMALATSEKSSLRGEEKSKAWEKVKLKSVFTEIAKRNGMKLVWQSSDNPTKDRVEQDNETDLAFIYRLCKDEGLCLKIANNSIVVLNEEDYEKQEAKYYIRRKSKETDLIKVIERSFSSTLTDTYKACKVTHTVKKKTISATFTPKKQPKTGRILNVKQEVKSQAEALRIAKKKLREKNKEATTVTLKVYSLVPLYAGMTFKLVEYGKLNGKYIASKVVHNDSYTTLYLRRCLEGY